MARCVNCNTTVSRGHYLCKGCRKELGIPEAQGSVVNALSTTVEILLSLPLTGWSFDRSNRFGSTNLQRQVHVVERQVQTIPDPHVRTVLLNHSWKQTNPAVWLEWARYFVEVNSHSGPFIRVPKFLLYGPSFIVSLLVAVMLIALLGIFRVLWF